MCDFPSWYKTPMGDFVYLLDEDAERLGIAYVDAEGHAAIREAYPGLPAGSKQGEGFPCPPQLARDIMAGKRNKIMKAGKEYSKVVLSEKTGEFHCEDGPAVIHPGTEDYAKVTEYWVHGQLHRLDGPAVIEGRHTTWFVEYVEIQRPPRMVVAEIKAQLAAATSKNRKRIEKSIAKRLLKEYSYR